MLPGAGMCCTLVRRGDCLPEGWAGGLHVLHLQLVEGGGDGPHQVSCTPNQLDADAQAPQFSQNQTATMF